MDITRCIFGYERTYLKYCTQLGEFSHIIYILYTKNYDKYSAIWSCIMHLITMDKLAPKIFTNFFMKFAAKKFTVFLNKMAAPPPP